MNRMLMVVLLAGCASPRQATRPADAKQEVYFCRYNKPSYYLPHGVLSLSPDGPPVMTFDEKQARTTGIELTLPWGPGDQPVKGAFTTGWVTYRMYLKPSKPVVVYPLEPLQLGVLELSRSAPLEFLGTEGGGMRARVKPVESFRSSRPLEVSLKCTETGIAPGSSGWADEGPRDAGAPQKLELAAGEDIPVSMTPGGTADGVLRVEDKPWARTAVVLEEQPEHVRIRYTAWPGRVVGWVPRRFTKPVDSSDVLGVGGLLGGLGLRGREGAGKPAWARCAGAVPLYLLHDGALEPAGDLRANAAYEVLSESSEATVIDLPENEWLKLQPGYRWALAPGDLAKCQTKPADKEPARM